MKKNFFLFFFCCCVIVVTAQSNACIRINQLGYTPNGLKIAVLGSNEKIAAENFAVINTANNVVVFTKRIGADFGKYGPFVNTYRLDFSSFGKSGNYIVRVDNIVSPAFTIDVSVYDGAADFCLRYMRQQRSGFNPFLKDSCHAHDGYTLYAPVPDSTHINVIGGWHDASDYLQYSTTSANATYHLLAAYRDFPTVFKDEKEANGLDGKNHITDVLDEAKWGLDWLLKMHPKDGWLFNQLGDDRDHRGMRIPKEDTNFYGRGLERPVYFCNGKPQVRGKFMNNSTGVASTAGKFSSAFALGSAIFFNIDKAYADKLYHKSITAYALGLAKPGVAQTASVLSPYIYAEDNWTDDMELASAIAANKKDQSSMLDNAYQYALKDPITPWLGADTAKHYQWYPFINVGHYELAKELTDKRRDTIIQFYKEGIDRVWQKARSNAFYHAIPFIWCSNNLTVSFAIQCYWYRQLTSDNTYMPLEQACFDWIFGCNPWGTSMVYGLPSWGDTPTDPHSAFTHLKNYPIDGGLVDGPVYTSIYKNLIGIQLFNADEYAAYQSDLAVYHDDYGDYSTNEPTMDGTASLIYLLAAQQSQATKEKHFTYSHGGIVRGDSTKKEIALVFTADEFGDGLPVITKTLQEKNLKASFFFTGRFYRNKKFQPAIQQLYVQRNYMGPHSDEHLLYNDWNNRDSLLVSHDRFNADMQNNLSTMQHQNIMVSYPQYFIPPYEWWNDTIAAWSNKLGLKLFNFTSGIRTNADYTYPEMGNTYKSSEWILQSLKDQQDKDANAFNGAIILIHTGTDPRRKDKLYNRLNDIIDYLQLKGYVFKRIDDLLK
ncbi:polysaccharide deacetylase family protein [Panacibacter ginsenosidivorans]|uniref:Polysaccharide deacetylase family protein n=1 Tax=Panacibacter ginsenosidivorans TaxID=1813871 RepID=A0A5B8V867_9BACT|nr:glycoside hydrolase family 9 protein [Panacibacter ginsenosidivorans]QEC66906.1 polysaccharide deacetylase family protein [Panacibacter ginsenosidivorans]